MATQESPPISLNHRNGNCFVRPLNRAVTTVFTADVSFELPIHTKSFGIYLS